VLTVCVPSSFPLPFVITYPIKDFIYHMPHLIFLPALFNPWVIAYLPLERMHAQTALLLLRGVTTESFTRIQARLERSLNALLEERRRRGQGG
jgi:hypothetical protein